MSHGKRRCGCTDERVLKLNMEGVRMNEGVICDKWAFPMYVELKDETDRSKSARSYLHYLSEHVPLVSAKCQATEWLLGGLDSRLSVREYFGGAGLVSMIVKGLLKPSAHVASDRDERCVQQLKGLLGNENAFQAEAKKAVLESDGTFDIQILDYPRFTVLSAMGPWEKALTKLFMNRPRYVVLTDTACSYITVNGKLYQERLNSSAIRNGSDYTAALSQYFMARYGYSIHRAAYRHRNAAYYLCAQGIATIEERTFKLDGKDYGFHFVG